MADQPGQSTEMIELGMGADEMIDGPDPSVPQIRRYHTSAHVKSLVGRASVDNDDLPVRQFDHGTISLSDIKKRDAKPVPVKPQPRRPDPPQQNDCNTTYRYSTKKPPTAEPYRDGETSVERHHRCKSRRRYVPFRSWHPRGDVNSRHEAVEEPLHHVSHRQVRPAGHQLPDAGPQP